MESPVPRISSSAWNPGPVMQAYPGYTLSLEMAGRASQVSLGLFAVAAYGYSRCAELALRVACDCC